MDYQNYWIMTLISHTILLLIGCHQIKGIRLTNISIPKVADFRDVVELSCSYDIGNHTLNSVKWYKDKSEFYRFTPLSQEEKTLKFPVPGVTLYEDHTSYCNRVTCKIKLTRLGPKTSGHYSCEVSGDAPEFKLAHDSGNMMVVALPKSDPFISGLSHSYAVGDFLSANCTSDASSPAANLYWYIDNDKAPLDALHRQDDTKIETQGFKLSFRSLEIRYYIDSSRVGSSKRSLKLRCLARIDKVPSAAAIRESIVEVRIQRRDETVYDKYLFSSVCKIHHQHGSFTALIIFTIAAPLFVYLKCLH